MKDIIAVARVAGFKITEHKTGAFIDAPSPCNMTVSSLISIVEAEIREAEIGRFGKALGESNARMESYRDMVVELEHELTTLTAQNAKLMEALEKFQAALELYCPDHVLLRPERLAIIEPIVDELVAALTPQPEKEGKE